MILRSTIRFAGLLKRLRHSDLAIIIVILCGDGRAFPGPLVNPRLSGGRMNLSVDPHTSFFPVTTMPTYVQ